MKDGVTKRLVTLHGECFDADYQGKQSVANRDGVLHSFGLRDLVKARGVIPAPIWRFGPRDLYTPSVEEYDRREDIVLVNVIRRMLDSGDLSFDAPARHKEISLQSSDFQKQTPRSDSDIRAYLIHKAYWLGYRHPERNLPGDVLYPIQFDELLDLEYLGVETTDLRRNISRLGNQGLFEKIHEGHARPSEKLLNQYESNDWAALGLRSVATLAPLNRPDDRRFARLAIDEARKSVPESDGRPHPKVGAVVVKDGRVLSTAYRGEMPANHAEYIALEKKLSDAVVAGATVYTTLEPCTTRNHPKIPCADRLIERRVARVVIGMLDPDDRISGKGQRKSRRAGIVTDLFPHDLAMEVEELNREFTRYCEQQPQAQKVSESSQKAEPGLIRGDVLQVYTGDDGNHDGNLIVLLRVVSEFPNPVTIIDFWLKVTTEDGEIFKGQLDRGDLHDWILISEHKEAARHSPVTSVIKTQYTKLEPALLRTAENEPLVHGVHKQGWLVFAFPSDEGWMIMGKLEKAQSITLGIVDALKRNYEVPIAQPWNQPSRIIHGSWFPKGF